MKNTIFDINSINGFDTQEQVDYYLKYVYKPSIRLDAPEGPNHFIVPALAGGSLSDPDNLHLPTPPVPEPDYHFYGSMSEEVLHNYMDKAIDMWGMFENNYIYN